MILCRMAEAPKDYVPTRIRKQSPNEQPTSELVGGLRNKLSNNVTSCKKVKLSGKAQAKACQNQVKGQSALHGKGAAMGSYIAGRHGQSKRGKEIPNFNEPHLKTSHGADFKNEFETPVRATPTGSRWTPVAPAGNPNPGVPPRQNLSPPMDAKTACVQGYKIVMGVDIDADRGSRISLAVVQAFNTVSAEMAAECASQGQPAPSMDQIHAAFQVAYSLVDTNSGRTPQNMEPVSRSRGPGAV